MSEYHTVSLSELAKDIVDSQPELVRSLWTTWDGKTSFASRGRLLSTTDPNAAIYYAYFILPKDFISELLSKNAESLPPGDWLGLAVAAEEKTPIDEFYQAFTDTEEVEAVPPEKRPGSYATIGNFQVRKAKQPRDPEKPYYIQTLSGQHVQSGFINFAEAVAYIKKHLIPEN